MIRLRSIPGSIARPRPRFGARTDIGLGACLGPFEISLLAFDGDSVSVLAGDDFLAEVASRLEAPNAQPEAVILRLIEAGGEVVAAKLATLRRAGEHFDAIELAEPGLRIEGRTAGALALLLISGHRAAASDPAGRMTAFVDDKTEPCWIASSDGRLVWANRTWLAAVGAANLADARERALSIDAEADRAARAAADRREGVTLLRWIQTAQGRRAIRFRTQPLPGGEVGVWSQDVTDAETAAASLGRSRGAQEAMLERLADAVVVFSQDRRVIFHNPAFARLWDLEPAWLAERPTHGELLDRLRRRGALPDQADFAAFKAAEVARHEALDPSPESLWRLPSERTLKVSSQPHASGGLMMVFSDVTPELRLRAQFNHLLQVQQATLDKLSDAVAVFGADGRLRLHNEAFEHFWSAGGQLNPGLDFDEVVELARPRLHDLQFWRDLKGRIADPDPAARAPSQSELVTSDRRIVAHQSRPLPDGATLVSFADVTDTRRLEGALADREAALSDAERLKREFVNSVSHELRTPLTTILGYAELLERAASPDSDARSGPLTAIRSAATQLARSIDNVLVMAQFDAGEVAMEMGDVDVDSLLTDTVATWIPIAEAQKVELIVETQSPIGLMRGDERRLGEALGHLIENALRHTPGGGRVVLSAERAHGEVSLKIADSGRGIPFHVQAHIFDRFSGQDQTASGLGLPLVKALIELHGGWVSLESEPGAGSTFTCHLPEAPEGGEARPELFTP